MNSGFILAPGIDIRPAANGRLLIKTPTDSFVIVDTMGIVSGTIDCLERGADIAAAFGGIAPDQRAAATDHVVAMLRQRRVIVAQNDMPARDTDPLFTWLRHVAEAGATPVEIAVAGEGRLADTVAELLAEVDVAHRRDAAFGDAGLVVACFDSDDEAGVRAINRRAVAADVPLLVAMADRHVAAIGPLVLPHATACFECYFHRVRSNRRTIDADAIAPSRQAASRLTLRLAAVHAVGVALRFVAGAAFDLHVATITRHNVLDGRVGDTVVLKVPRCPVCGQANAARPLAPTFAVAAPDYEEAA